MTVTVSNIIPPTVLTITSDTYYASAGFKTIIDKFTIVNPTNATTVFIDVHIVPNGAVASDANILSRQQPIFPDNTYTFPAVVGHTMKPGDFIAIKCSNNQAVVRASGRLVSQ